jgi:hypothetical protein
MNETTDIPGARTSAAGDARQHRLSRVVRREASGGWIIQASEPLFTIGGLRHFLNGVKGITPPHYRF